MRASVLSFALYGLMITTFITTSVLLLLSFFGPTAGRGIAIAAVGTATVLAFLLDARLSRGALRRRLRRLLDEGSTPREALLRVLAGARPTLHIAVMHALAEALQERGQRDVLRVARPGFLTAIRPIDVPFDIRPLDEAHSGFELFRDDAEDASAASTGSVGARSAPDPLVARVMRNIRRQGGVWLVALLLLMALFEGYRSWLAGRVSVELLVMLVPLAIFVVVPVALELNRSEWFLAPGAIVLRGTRRGDLRVLTRAGCTLVGCRVPMMTTCFLIVADGRSVYHRSATQAELDAALRAWLSPRPPPSADQLADLGD